MPKPKKPRGARVEFHRAKDGHRWRAWSKNGRIVAESGEGYSSLKKAWIGAQSARVSLIMELQTAYETAQAAAK